MANSKENKTIKLGFKELIDTYSEQQQARLEAMDKAARELKNTQLKALNIIAYAIDHNLSALYYIGAIQNITGYEECEFINNHLKWKDLIHPGDLKLYNDVMFNLFHGQEAQICEYRIISGQGQIRWVTDMAVPIQDNTGKPLRIEGLVIDITSRKQTEEMLLDRQAQMDSILSSVQDVIWSVTPDTFDLIYISPSAEKIYGYPLEKIYEDAANGYELMHAGHEILLENFNTLLQQGWFEAEYSISLPNGETRWLNRRAHFAKDTHGFVARIDGTDQDITRRKEAEETLRYISTHDALTGLFNRFYFEKHMHAIDSGSLKDLGLLVCDVDGLKYINDNLGHDAGDQLLKQCAEVLTGTFSHNNEIVSRIGGDEFTVIIKNCAERELNAAVERLRQAVIDYNREKASIL